MKIVNKIKSFICRGLGIRCVRYVKAHVSYLSSSEKLSSKNVVITGGSRGLGLAMAAKFIEEGADVLIAGRCESSLREKAAALGCKFAVLDIREIDTFDEFLNNVYAQMGRVDVLVNNAGISLHEEGMLAVTEAQFNNQFDTNLKGAYFLTQKFIARHIETHQKESTVLFVSSERGQTADTLPYGLTKAALNSLVQGLAYKYIQQGIRTNALAPGVTASDMTGFKSDGNLNCSYNITQRVYLPEEVAEIACFLVSDAARILNGQIIVCNEGKTINFR